MSIVLKHINTDVELENIKDKWKLLDHKTQHHNICSSYYWVYNWWSIFKNVENNKIGYNKELVIICVYEDDQLALVCPLMKLKRKKYGFSVSFIEFIGQQWSGVYYDIVAYKRYLGKFDEIQSYLREKIKYDILFLRYIPESSPNFKTEDLLPFTKCPEINLCDYNSFENYSTLNYSKSHKQNLRSGRNRALKNKDKLEEVIEQIDDENFQTITILSKSKLISDKSWLYGDKNKKEFYNKIHKSFDSNVVFIKINKTKVAYRTNVIFNNMKLCTDASYDRNAPKYELGILSVNKNIDNSFNNRLVLHSLGPGLDLYKLKFTKKFKQLFFLLKKGNTYKSIIIYPLMKLIINNKK